MTRNATIPSAVCPGRATALALIAASLVLIALLAPAPGAYIVNNPSFESPTVGDGQISWTITDWTATRGGQGSAVATFNPTNDWFSGTTGSATPAGADGINVVTTHIPNTGGWAGVTQVITDAQLTAGETYLLTAALGAPKNNTANDWRLGISTQSMSLGSYLAKYEGTADQLTMDEFNDFSVSYTATGLEPQIGENLRITIWGQNAGAGGTHVLFDNVRFIPEPSAALLVLSALACGMLVRRRKKE